MEYYSVNAMWSESEKNFIRENAARLKDYEIAAALSRVTGRLVTEAAVRHARNRLGIKKRHGRGICEVRRPQSPGQGLGITIQAD